MRNVPSLETIYLDYEPKGVRFYYLYKALAHPGLNGYIRPHTLEERLLHVAEAERTLGSGIPWIVDSMNNDLRHAIGNMPNSEYVVDGDGKILRMRAWSDPATLRADLEELVGPVDEATQISDLEMKTEPPPDLAPTGIVPRLEKEGRFAPLVVQPLLTQSKHPFYVKLRAEADADLLREGKGQLYLGFFPDPVHQVHWNNEVTPMRYVLSPPEGVSASPETASGPEVEEDADADPREFLAVVDRGESDEPLRMEFHYYACSPKWCIPVSQSYDIRWERDADAGRPINEMRRGGGFLSRLLEYDLNGDGRLVMDELPEPMQARFDRMDSNADGFLDAEDQPAGRGPGGPGGGRGGPGGPGGFAERLKQLDTDGDGKLSREEVPERMQRVFDRMDRNEDGYLEEGEVRSPRGRR